jgi:hypothetical protein
VAALILLWGCGEGLAACDRRPWGADECRMEEGRRLVERGDLDALAVVADEGDEDVLRVRLAKTFPSHADRLCAGVKAPPMREKCSQVAGRPHLLTP